MARFQLPAGFERGRLAGKAGLQHLTRYLGVAGDIRNAGIHHRYIVVDLCLGNTFALRSERTLTNGSISTRESHVSGGGRDDAEDVVEMRAEERAQDGVVGVADLAGAGQVVA